MFDFLKKPTHHHPAPPKLEYSQPEPIKKVPNITLQNSMDSSFAPQYIKIESKKVVKKAASVKKYQQNKPVKLTKQVKTIFQQLLTESKSIVNNKLIDQLLDHQMKGIQKRVYTRQIAINEGFYLHQLFQKISIPNLLVKQSLDDLISGTVANITFDIQNNMSGYNVYKKKIMTKQDLIEIQKMDQIRMIKLKQGQIADKVGELRMQLNIIEDPIVQLKAKQIIQKDTFGKDSQKTKQAQKFVEQKKLQKQQIERKKQQQSQRKKLKQLEQKVETEIKVEKAKSERHAKLLSKLQAKQILKSKRQQQVAHQQQKFKNFLKEYKKVKPLYQQKVQQQLRRQIQERQQRYQKLSSRKNVYNPLNLEQIEDFEQKYLQLKRQQGEKKQIQNSIKMDEQKFRIQEMKDKYYKGKYRYLVLEQMVNKQAIKKQEEFKKYLLIEKKRSYSVDVKDKFKPKIDQNKRIQSQKFVKTQKKRKQKGPRRVRINSSNPNEYQTISYDAQQIQQQPDQKKQGHKNMRLFKQYIHQKIQRGQIKRPQTLQSKISYTPKLDYLREQRQNRQTRNSSFSYHSLDVDSRIRRIKKQSNGDVEIFKMKAEQFDQKARRQELKLKYSQHTPHDQKILQQDYLSSIKAKLELLNQCK